MTRFDTDSTRNPDGIQTESDRIRHGIQTESDRTPRVRARAPTSRPVPRTTDPPYPPASGGNEFPAITGSLTRQRDKDALHTERVEWGSIYFPTVPVGYLVDAAMRCRRNGLDATPANMRPVLRWLELL